MCDKRIVTAGRKASTSARKPAHDPVSAGACDALGHLPETVKPEPSTGVSDSGASRFAAGLHSTNRGKIPHAMHRPWTVCQL